MSRDVEPQEELGFLAAALCDGQITPEQAARLEAIVGPSPEARRYLLAYLQLHGELYWEHAASVGASMPEVLPARPLVRSRSLLHWAVVATTASLLIAIAAWQLVTRNLPQPVPVVIAAQVTLAMGAKWQGEAKPVGEPLVAGEKLELAEGLVEIAFRSGARVVLEGPALLGLESPACGTLHHGSLVAQVADPATRFTIDAPGLTVVDLGTEFGVAAEPARPSEVHVFTGKVQVRSTSLGPPGAWQLVSAGQAVRGGLPTGKLEPIAAGSRHFVRSLPRPDAGSVIGLREQVRRNPHLIHHYTFEGLSAHAQRQDKRGSLSLTEAVMRAGRTGGTLRYSVPGWDSTTRAVRPYRSLHDGNNCGVALQSEAPFQPPQRMTVELLVNFTMPEADDPMPIACAVATRADQRRCGFFVVAADAGHLAHLMDGDAAWLEAHDEFAFQPGDWYYVASTFSVVPEGTRVNTYVANLSRGEQRLTWAVRDQLTPGTPAASRLGIGKGFDANTAHAYPWSGMLDEVALYDTVLDQKTLEEHLRSLFRNSGP